MKKNMTSLALAAALVAGVALPVQSASAAAGDWIVRGGVTWVVPDESSDKLVVGGTATVDTRVSIDNDIKPSFTITYMLTDAIGIELLGALPFKHDVDGKGGPFGGVHLAEAKHLPPTLSLQYHFNQFGAIKPYVGAGINYTVFFDEKATGNLKSAGFTKVSLKESFGYALQVGMDYDLGNNWLVNADVRYIDIETEARLSGPGGVKAKIDNIEIDPFVFTLAVGKRF